MGTVSIEHASAGARQARPTFLASASLAALLGTIIPCSAAWAQTAQSSVTPPPPTKDQNTGGGLEDIVVTARKVEEKLSTVPLAITALSEKQLEARGISSINDISSFTPSFRFQNVAAASNGRADRSFSTLTFRGLTLSGDYFTTAGGLLFVDGAPEIGAAPPSIFEVQRVEILKGPQSAFFGRSTFSGAINFVSKDPPTKFSAELNGSVASYDSFSASGSVGGSLIPDLLRVRVSAAYDREGGQYRNEAAPYQRFGTQRTTSTGLQYLITPADGLRIKGSFSYSEDNDGPPASIAIKGSESNCNLGGTEGAYFCGKLPSENNLPAGIISGNYVIDSAFTNLILQNKANLPTLFGTNFIDHGGLERHLIQTSVRADYDFGGGYTLSSITAYHHDKLAVITDLNYRYAGNTPNPAAATIPNAPPFYKALVEAQSLSHDFSQEVRLTSPQNRPFRWLIGANYFTASSYYANGFGITQLGPVLTAYPPRVHPRTPAVFGAANLDLGRLTLSGELRYQIDHVAQDVETSGNNFLATPIQFKQTYKSFQPRVTATYHLDKDAIVYALFARGYRPGGFNSDLSKLSATAQASLAASGIKQAYGQESIDNFEFGTKGNLFNNHIQYSLDAYYELYRDGQINQSTFYQTSPTTVTVGTFTQNTGKINLYGIEAELNWQLTRHFQMNGTFAWNDNHIKRYYCANCVFIDGTNSAVGRKLPYVPRFTGTLSGEYQDHLSGNFDWFVRADDIFRSKIFADPANQSYIGDKNTINMRLGVRNDHYSIEAFCTNCSNNLVADAAFYGSSDFLFVGTGRVGQEIRYQLPARRVIGLRAGWKL